ncbi:aminomethyl-transferring glycine dehydrogenase subunit GcvPA [Vagococcus acidifermentans]|uniref:Probable glycine dehydrogenase (decarboxylating) subunit 1 n=1 Tax=Vagococcus acidifermentans TaxID=564710 RepID=A0A430B0R0_9ENTE|nr:aminomethyl-transferring glycine dehydrogenase subunit GcvPA [Vagococcus acidifermentans]RSU13908.1 glycine dehydrogenase (aminomethyl-transferring) [Vagococcus acidifermentans]
MGKYIPSTSAEQQEMLSVLGITSIDEIFAEIPEDLRVGELNLPEGKSELEVRRIMQGLADKNHVFTSVFRGAGAYRHYIPAIVKQISGKEEFLTAYTPYQAEISQGILQSIFEFQTMVAELTGLPVSNASVYDGANAAAEAVNMCIDRKKKRVLVSATTHPMTVQTIRTYCHAMGTEVVIVPAKDGVTDMAALESLADTKTACFFVQQPNYFGGIEDCTALGEIIHSFKGKFIMGINPIASAVLKTPAECDADIATGEGQPLGLPLAFGGPYLGFMAAKEELTRKLPGRIVGETTDKDGKRAFVLTLQAREQHIRREKASSNICSNQAHCALTASIYLTTMGPKGLREVANHCYSKAHYLAEQLATVKGFERVHTSPFFHEFLTTAPAPAEELLQKLEEKNILGGLPVGGNILWCATEMNTKEDIDSLVAALKEVVD